MVTVTEHIRPARQAQDRSKLASAAKRSGAAKSTSGLGGNRTHVYRLKRPVQEPAFATNPGLLRTHLQPAAMSSRPLESNQNLLLFKRTRRPHTPERGLEHRASGRMFAVRTVLAGASARRSLVVYYSIVNELHTAGVVRPGSSAWLGTRVTCTAVVVAAPTHSPVRIVPDPGFEPGSFGSEPSVLPLDESGSVPPEGFEPPTHGLKARCDRRFTTEA